MKKTITSDGKCYGFTIQERFEKKFKVNVESGCWEWNLALNRQGYGYFRINRVTKLAHRVSFFIYKGEFKESLLICHRCDNPKCVNPEHLFLGTQLDNMKDCKNKGRTKQINHGTWRMHLLKKCRCEMCIAWAKVKSKADYQRIKAKKQLIG